MNRAQTAIDAVHDRPRDALDLAARILADDSATVDERAQACWALGRAHSELDHIEQACSALEDGLVIARDGSLTELAAEIRVSLSVCLLTAGNTAKAREMLVEAEHDIVAPASRGRLAMQQGLIDLHLGRFDSAGDHLDRAEKSLPPGVDNRARARVLINRGIVNSMSGQLDAGEADFIEARRLAEETGQKMMGAGAAQNLGFAAGRKGNVPGALSWFSEARSSYGEVGSPPRAMAILDSDLCSVLLSGGLYAEAAEAARRAAAMAATGGNRLAEAEALLLLARVKVADGSAEAAEKHAATAAGLFIESERGAWAALADYVGLQATAMKTQQPDEALLNRATEIAGHLLANGWRRDSLEVRTFAGRIALELGRPDTARSHLLLAAEARHSGSSAMRANAWLAAATLQLTDGDRAGAREALSTGMEIVEEYRSSLASTELRASASINGTELAELGLRLAAEDGEAHEVFRWAERRRGAALSLVPVRDDPSSRLAKARVELREAYAATIEGTVDPFENDTEEQVATLEREIRDLTRAKVPDAEGDRETTGLPGVDAIRARLGTTTLVEYFTIGSDLHAITVTAENVAVRHLGALDDVVLAIRKTNSALARIAFASSSPTMAEATDSALRATAAQLDDRLIGTLGLPDTTGASERNTNGRPDGEVVIVPSGALQSLAWPVLPSLAERAVSIAPSATLWAAGKRPARRAARRNAVLVCGPNLAGGPSEIEHLASLYEQPTVLVEADASVAAVAAAIEKADLVHIAAHGVFRADNPMFSALELHDGPLTVYDLETLSNAPGTVVLSACDAGRSSSRFGDELLGTASALLQLGVGTVIAPVTVVPDADVVPAVMVELHRSMLGGTAPATALLEARKAVAEHEHGLTARAFVAIGTSTGNP